MTARLGSAALANWEALDGYAVAHGVPDPRTLPLSRFCSFVWYMMTCNVEKQAEIETMRAQLWRPLPKSTAPIPTRSPWSAENETKAFGALTASLGAKKVTAQPAGSRPGLAPQPPT